MKSKLKAQQEQKVFIRLDLILIMHTAKIYDGDVQRPEFQRTIFFKCE